MASKLFEKLSLSKKSLDVSFSFSEKTYAIIQNGHAKNSFLFLNLTGVLLQPIASYFNGLGLTIKCYNNTNNIKISSNVYN